MPSSDTYHAPLKRASARNKFFAFFGLGGWMRLRILAEINTKYLGKEVRGMARPAKPAEAGVGKIGKQEKTDRKNAENKLKGDGKNVKPAYKLTKVQKKIFNTIRKILEDAEVLGELDSYVLTATAVAADRIAEIDVRVNDNPDLMLDKDIAGVRGKYWSDFRQGCNELGLSPQARAKLGIVAAANKSKESDPLAKLLTGGDEDEPD